VKIVPSDIKLSISEMIPETVNMTDTRQCIHQQVNKYTRLVLLSLSYDVFAFRMYGKTTIKGRKRQFVLFMQFVFSGSLYKDTLPDVKLGLNRQCLKSAVKPCVQVYVRVSYLFPKHKTYLEFRTYPFSKMLSKIKLASIKM